MQLAKHLRCSLHVEALDNVYLLYISDNSSSYIMLSTKNGG